MSIRTTTTIQSIQAGIDDVALSLYRAADRLHADHEQDVDVWDQVEVIDLMEALEFATEAASRCGAIRDRVAVKIANRCERLTDEA